MENNQKGMLYSLTAFILWGLILDKSKKYSSFRDCFTQNNLVFFLSNYFCDFKKTKK